MVISDIPYDSPYTLKAEDRICIRLTSEDDDNLYELLTRWEKTCYQTYLLYILEPTKVQDLEKVLEEDKYKETDSLDKVWSKVRLLIKNEWEAEYHNTFVLVLHKEDFESVKGYIERYTGSRYKS